MVSMQKKLSPISFDSIRYYTDISFKRKKNFT